MNEYTKDALRSYGIAIIMWVLIACLFVLMTGWFKARAIKNLTGKDVGIIDASQVTILSNEITTTNTVTK